MNFNIENLIDMIPSFTDNIIIKLREEPDELSLCELRFFALVKGIRDSTHMTKNEILYLLGLSTIVYENSGNNKDLSSIKVLFTNINDKENTEVFESITQASLCLWHVRSPSKMRNIIKFGTVFWYNGKKWTATRIENKNENI